MRTVLSQMWTPLSPRDEAGVMLHYRACSPHYSACSLPFYNSSSSFQSYGLKDYGVHSFAESGTHSAASGDSSATGSSLYYKLCCMRKFNSSDYLQSLRWSLADKCFVWSQCHYITTAALSRRNRSPQSTHLFPRKLQLSNSYHCQVPGV